MSSKQQKVINKAKEILQKFNIKTVCLDKLPNHDGFNEEEIIQELVDDTLYWESGV